MGVKNNRFQMGIKLF